jgi:hypothetical protein
MVGLLGMWGPGGDGWGAVGRGGDSVIASTGSINALLLISLFAYGKQSDRDARMDRLQAVQTFVAVAEAGGFTAAAERLGLPKASVSQRLSALESHRGTRNAVRGVWR